MQTALTETAIARRHLQTLESLRVLTNIEICAHSECHGVQIRRIFVTEPDALGCNWQAEWPTVRAANAEPCRSQLHAIIEQIRERYNVAR
jgi:hypothetical protein